MNHLRLIIAIVLLAGASRGVPAQQEQDSVKVPEQQQRGGAGVVIEYRQQQKQTDAGAPEQQAQANADPEAAGSSVELIVGGSAEDGVAKRRDMPVRK